MMVQFKCTRCKQTTDHDYRIGRWVCAHCGRKRTPRYWVSKKTDTRADLGSDHFVLPNKTRQDRLTYFLNWVASNYPDIMKAFEQKHGEMWEKDSTDHEWHANWFGK